MPRRATSPRPGDLRRWAVALLALLALIAAACGDDSEGGSNGDGDDGDDIAARFECPVGAHEDAGGPVEVTVWHAYNTLTQETLESIAADYNASQDVVTVRVEAQGTYDELLAKYEDALGDPDTLPDVVFAEDTTTQFMIDSGTVLPAASCIDADDGASEFYDEVIDSVTNAYTVQGALWPAAFGVSMPIMYVNDDHLRAADLDPEDRPGTLDELRAAAEKIVESGPDSVQAPVVMLLDGWYVENWLTGARQPIVDNDNGRDGLATGSEVQNEATLEILEWIRDMSEDGLLKTFGADVGTFDHYLALAQQSSSILIDGSRAITPIVAVIDGARQQLAGVDVPLDDVDLQGLDVNVAPIVGLEDPGKGGVAGSAAFLVAGRDEAAVGGAWDFLRFFNTIDNQVRWTLEGSYLPITTTAQQHPDLVDAFSSSRSGQWLATAFEQLQNLDHDFTGPVMGPYKEFRAGIQDAMEQVAAGRTDPATALDAFDSALEEQLRDYADEVG